MEVVTITRGSPDYPVGLLQMAKPPAAVYYRGAPLARLLKRPCVAVVGSRRMSAYGKQVTTRLVHELAGQGIVIVSGLAYGVDAAAHSAALEVGGCTLAVLPSPVEAPAPLANRQLAERIASLGGGLISRYPAGSSNNRYNFVARNEMVAALSAAVIVTEAAARSGSLHTAQFALDMNVLTFAVPGPITAELSAGTNQLLKSRAAPVTDSRDILTALGIQAPADHKPHGDNPAEQCILDMVSKGISEGNQLFEQSGLPIQLFNQTLTMLEITAKILPLGANHWGLP